MSAGGWTGCSRTAEVPTKYRPRLTGVRKLLWEQGIAGSSPAAPTSGIPRFLCLIWL